MTETTQRYTVSIFPADNNSVTTTEAQTAVAAQRAINWTLKNRGGAAVVTDTRNGNTREFTHDGTTLTPVQS